MGARHWSRAQGWAQELGTGAGHWSRALELGTGAGHWSWAQELGTGAGHRSWAQGQGTGAGHWSRAQELGTGAGHRSWAQGLGTVAGHWSWAQGLGTGDGHRGRALEQGTGAGHWSWALEQGTGAGHWSWAQEQGTGAGKRGALWACCLICVYEGRGDLQPQVDSALQDVSDKYVTLQETERQAVRRALIEERARFCTLVSMLRPAVEEEVCMLGEITHLQSISDDLRSLTMDPHKLPPSSEQVIADLKGSECSWSYQTPPSSPSTTSRKSSMCSSSLNSVNSSDSRSSSSHSHSPTSHFRFRGSTLPQQGPARLPSVSSHDSGFTSQETCQSKSPSPMPPDSSAQHSGFSCPDESYQPITDSLTSTLPDSSTNTEEKLLNGCESLSPYAESSSLLIPPSSPPPSYPFHHPLWAWSRPGDFVPCFLLGPSALPLSHRVPSWKDWVRPGPYDQPTVNTLRRGKDQERGREGREFSSLGEEAPNAIPNASTRGTTRDEAHEELAVCLKRGLSLDIPRSSRDSVQGSSGYSTQTNTPCCSEDAHVFDYDHLPGGEDHDPEQRDCDGTSPISRNPDIGQSYRRTLPAKRPASTGGLPSPCAPVTATPGIATIRRAPSSKPSLWRGSSGQGPIPIRTPVIPVKTPTVPELPAPPLCSEGRESPRSPTGNGSNQLPSERVAASFGQSASLPEEEEEGHDVQEDDTPLAIRRGMRLKKTMTSDRFAPLLE
ncbi:hypothetical protein P4O66_015304 [Electrophorus voltai]|uniref:IMD domain-containing protein n=1 Tax=Electrophorus voltai TaxID=2609070 RepID=A0AAD9DNM3_9TELE|nr:hypothetical protein P4O66_015304 [Electrophorus voltai]